jgi:anti-sigma B factor antagonist
MTLRTEVTDRGAGDHVLEVQGDVDMATAPCFKEALQAALQKARCLRVDLSMVEFMESAGLAVLLSIYRTGQERGVKLVLLDPSEQVQGLIDMAMLGQLFTVERSGSGA